MKDVLIIPSRVRSLGLIGLSFLTVVCVGFDRLAAAQNPQAEPKPAPASMPEQVRVEARILEWQTSNSMEFDFAVAYTRNEGMNSAILEAADLTLPADPALTSAARLFFDGMDYNDLGSFDAVVEILEQVGSVRILSQPSIMLEVEPGLSDLVTEDNRAFEINSPDPAPVKHRRLSNAVRIPYETTKSVGAALASVTEYKDSGVTMDVAVLDVNQKLVTLDMKTTVSDLTGFISIGLNNYGEPSRVPTVDSRTIENRVIIPDGAVSITGVMKTSRESDRRRGIPWVSEVPLLGWLLSSKKTLRDEAELVFLVKPEIVHPYKIIDPLEPPSGSL